MTTALSFWKWVVADENNTIERVFGLLDDHGIRYCVVGGMAMNAYADPVITLDLDIAIATDQLDDVLALFASDFKVEEFEHSINLSVPGSRMQVQIQKDDRYPPFVERAQHRWLNDLFVPVASPEDLLSGKLWAATDPARRASKRLKDLADIRRLVDEFPELVDQLPEKVRRDILL